MSVQSRVFTDRERAIIDRRLESMFRFMSEVLEDPNRLEQLPESSVLIVLDPDAPAYNEGRLDDARHRIARERTTYAWRLNAEPSEIAAFPVLPAEPNGDNR